MYYYIKDYSEVFDDLYFIVSFSCFRDCWAKYYVLFIKINKRKYTSS